MRFFWGVGALLWIWQGTAWALPIPREDCFPVETLPAVERKIAREMLRQALGGHAFYTLTEPLKPTSSDFFEQNWNIRKPKAQKFQSRLQAAIAALHCGPDLFFHLVQEKNPNGWVHGHIFVVHAPSIRAVITKHAKYFGELGITPEQDPREILNRVFMIPGFDRFMGLGLVFGFPEERVVFFTEAMIQDEMTGKFVSRDFFRIPVLDPKVHNAVAWAMPRGAVPTAEERAFASRAERLRKRFGGQAGKTYRRTPEKALRSWFAVNAEQVDPDSQNCAPMLVPSLRSGGSR